MRRNVDMFIVVIEGEMKFLAQHHLYVNNMCAKFHGQKIYTQKKTYLKSTTISKCEKNFTITNFDTLPRI